MTGHNPGGGHGSRWHAQAERYDRWFDEPWGRYASAVEARAVLAAAGPLAGRTVAEVGCGTGRLTGVLASEAALVVGIDPDRAMLAVAARRTGVPLVAGDGHDLPVPQGAFDLAVAVTVCEFTADPARVVAEMARITRPGGRVLVGALNRHSAWGVANRSRFAQPPWDAAVFLDRVDLLALGRPHGDARVVPGLYAPGALPLLDRWGPLLDRVGRRLAPGLGAFNVLVVDRPPDHRAPPTADPVGTRPRVPGAD